jgi:predicted fused transcriptional regulator/phosphomethylpyrimidine kinase
LDFAVSNAGLADAKALPGAIHRRMNGLQVQIPPAFGYVVGVADAMPELRAAAADFTHSCHKEGSYLK